MLSAISLDKNQCLQQQMVDQLQDLISTGRLKPGTRMPSTRMLAEQLGVSRNTVVLTYDRLIAEGKLETRPAQGTFVVEPVSHRPHLRVVEGGEAHEINMPPPQIWRPDPSLFPLVRWRALLRTALDTLGSGVARQHPSGEPALRHAIAVWLSASRNIGVTPEQIVLAESRHHAVHIAAHIGLRQQAHIVLEDPCDELTPAAFSHEAASVTRVPVDADGMRTDLLPSGSFDLVYVTPTHQDPLGAMLSPTRRHALLEWSKRSGALILEDESCSELHYGHRRLPTLFESDSDGHVILMGSFAATLGPLLNLSFLVVPRHLCTTAANTCQTIGGVPSRIEQFALAELLQGGSYARHLHRVSRVYATRRDTLVTALHRHFGERQTVWGHQAGLHLAWFPPADFAPSGLVVQAARRCGLDAMTLPSSITHKSPGSHAVLLGFGALSETQIDQRVKRLAAALPRDLDMVASVG